MTVETVSSPEAPLPARVPSVTAAGVLFVLQGLAVFLGGGRLGAFISFALGLALTSRRPGQPIYELARRGGLVWAFVSAAFGILVGLKIHDLVYAGSIVAMSAALFLLVSQRIRTPRAIAVAVVAYFLAQGLMLRSVFAASGSGAPAASAVGRPG